MLLKVALLPCLFRGNKEVYPTLSKEAMYWLEVERDILYNFSVFFSLDHFYL